MTACGISGLFGGLFVDAAALPMPFNSLIDAVPVCAFAVAAFAVAFGFLPLVVVFFGLAMILSPLLLVSAYTNRLFIKKWCNGFNYRYTNPII